MTNINRGIDPLSEEERKALLDAIVAYFSDDLDQEIGLITAEDLLGFFMQNIGTLIYKKGVTDTRNLLADHLESLNVDLDLLATE